MLKNTQLTPCHSSPQGSPSTGTHPSNGGKFKERNKLFIAATGRRNTQNLTKNLNVKQVKAINFRIKRQMLEIQQIQPKGEESKAKQQRKQKKKSTITRVSESNTKRNHASHHQQPRKHSPLCRAHFLKHQQKKIQT